MQMASNRIAGALTATPDVCLTPPVPVPVPYFNTAFTATAVSFVPNVLICGGNALNLGTVLAVSTGDEPGVAHWTIKGPAAFLMGCPTVFFGGLPAIGLTHPGTSNTGNAPIGAVTIPSATNVFLAHGPEVRGHAVTPAEAAEIGRLVRGDAPTVEGALGADGVAHVTVRAFSSGVPARMHGLLRRLAAQGMRELVVDLRGNPGGLVDACVELAGAFLPAGSVILTAIDADGDERTYVARSPDPWRMPLTLLVDAETASAAELFAGCLHAHGRAALLGERTAGKGVGQTVAPALATMRYRLPDGREIGGAGLAPG
jgi:carboxyl-terminal processing protease